MTQNANWIAGLYNHLGISPDAARKALAVYEENQLGKSMAEHSQTDEHTERVTDLWNQGEFHRNPSREQIKVGPAEAASGGGAERMVKDYSHPAPQMGVTEQNDRFAAELGAMRGYMKSMADGHNGLAKDFTKFCSDVHGVIGTLAEQNKRLVTVTGGLLAKAEESEEKEEDKEKAKACATDASLSFGKAQKLFAKAKKAREAAKADGIAEGISKSLKDQARLLRQAGLRQLAKAQTQATAGQGYASETMKAITALVEAKPALKADMDAIEHKEEKEEEKAKKMKKAMKKALKAAKKAAAGGEGDAVKSDAKGNQADKQDPATGNQDDAAAKAIEALTTKMASVDDALSGVAMLKTDIAGLIDIVRGKPTNAKIEPLVTVKADVNTVNTIATKIETMIDNEELDQMQEHRARDILSKMEGVQAGHISESIFRSAVETAPQVVRSIFEPAIQAAA